MLTAQAKLTTRFFLLLLITAALLAGAWLGGTLDTSGSVVAAGALISETAMKIGVIVMANEQNAHALVDRR